MIWQNPLAWLGLFALAIPILIHLLGRRSAYVQPFPTLRFLDASVLLVRRQTRLTDLPLLLVRLAILALAVGALAQPLRLNDARERARQRLLARVIVIDTSASARGGLENARQTARGLAAEAQSALLVETAAPAAELAGASEWLRGKDGRREVIVLSDFQLGAVEQQDLAMLPAGIGVRLQRQPMQLQRATDSASMPELIGARAEALAALDAARSLAPAGSQLGDVTVVYADAPSRAQLLRASRPVSQRWRSLVTELSTDSAIEQLRSDSGGRLLVFTRAEPGSLASAELLLGLMRASSGNAAETETHTVADSLLQRWQRQAAAAAANTSESDGRWLWLGALLLLGLESLIRRRPRAA